MLRQIFTDIRVISRCFFQRHELHNYLVISGYEDLKKNNVYLEHLTRIFGLKSNIQRHIQNIPVDSLFSGKKDNFQNGVHYWTGWPAY